jgi:hypothetical protein
LNFNTVNTEIVDYMFYRAAVFNQNLTSWNVGKVSYVEEFRTYSALTDANTPAALR